MFWDSIFGSVFNSRGSFLSSLHSKRRDHKTYCIKTVSEIHSATSHCRVHQTRSCNTHDNFILTRIRFNNNNQQRHRQGNNIDSIILAIMITLLGMISNILSNIRLRTLWFDKLLRQSRDHRNPEGRPILLRHVITIQPTTGLFTTLSTSDTNNLSLARKSYTYAPTDHIAIVSIIYVCSQYHLLANTPQHCQRGSSNHHLLARTPYHTQQSGSLC